MYCTAHKENFCKDYCYGHCIGCENFKPGPDGVDMDALKEDAYERFKLHWMMDHGITLQTITSAFSDFITELCAEADETGKDLGMMLNHSFFEDWLEEHGFEGMLWPCFDEFCENEWQGDCMNEGNEHRGCDTCPVKACDTMKYRGSRCAALRAEAGDDSDPDGSEGTYVVEITSGTKITVTVEAANAKDAYDEAFQKLTESTPEEENPDIKTESFEELRTWRVSDK